MELLQGEIFVMAPEREPHACYSTATADYLRQLLAHRATIRDGKPITLPNQSETQPDIAIVAPPIWNYLAHHPYPSEIFWLIEYSHTTLNLDLGLKQITYAEANIAEYWVVNLRDLELIIFRNPSPQGYRDHSTLTDGRITPLAFPDVSIEVRRLFSSPTIESPHT